MDLFCNVDTGVFQTSITNQQPIQFLTFKRRDTVTLNLYLVKNGASYDAGEISGGLTSFSLALKSDGDYASAFLAYAANYVSYDDNGAGTYIYTFKLNLNTSVLYSLFTENSEVGFLSAMLEFQWVLDSDNSVHSSQTIPVLVQNDVIRGDEPVIALANPSYPDATSVFSYGAFSTASAFPATGVVNKLYQAQDTNFLYTWSGFSYVRVQSTILTGTSAPSDTLGLPGDLYYDTAAYNLYQKGSTSWATLGNLRGPTNSLSVGTVSTNAGTAATATITGTAPSQTLNLGLPATTLSIGTVSTGAAGSSASASITGTAPTQTLNLNIPTGATGAAGGAQLSAANTWTAQQNFSNPIQVGTSQTQGGAGTAQSVQAWGVLVDPTSGNQNLLTRIQFTPTADNSNAVYGIYNQVFNLGSIAYGNIAGNGLINYEAVATNRGKGPLYSIYGYHTHIGNQTDAFNTLPVVNCSITSGSATVTPASMTGLYVGQGVTGAYGSGIPANTVITVVGSSTITISNNATATNASVSLTFSGGVNSLYGYFVDLPVTTGPNAPIKSAYGIYISPQVPLISATINGTTSVTVSSTAGLAAGMPITATGIPVNTTISSITSATAFVISNAATTSGSTQISVQGYTVSNPYAIYQAGTSDKNYFAGYTNFAGINTFSTPVLAGTGSLAIPSVNVGNSGVQSGLFSGNGTKVGVSVAGTSCVEFTNGTNGDPYLLVNGTSTFNGQQTVTATSGSNAYISVKSSGSNASATVNLFASGLGSNKQFYISHDYSTGGLLFQYYNGSAFVNALLINTSGNVVTNQIGNTFGVKSGTNAKAGTFTLSSGSVTVSNTSVTANSVIMVTLKTASGTRAGNPDIVPTSGTGFTATGAATDNGTYNYVILEVN
jgi:hypothetical protein